MLILLLTTTASRAKINSLVPLLISIAPRVKAFVIITTKSIAARAKKWAIRKLKERIHKVLNCTDKQ